MKTKLLIRNIVGAIVGGVLGSLTCYYVSVILLPLGCLAGVLIGYYHERLIADYSRNLTAVGRFTSAGLDRLLRWIDRTANCINLPLKYLSHVADYLRRSTRSTKRNEVFGRHLVRAVVWLRSVPLLFVAWLQKHPVNRSSTITVLVCPLVALVLWLSGFLSIALPINQNSFLENPDSGWVQFLSLGLFISTVCVMISPILLLFVRIDLGARALVRQIRRYTRYGPIGWMLYEIKNAVMFFAFVFICAELFLVGLAVALCVAVLTIAFIVCVIIPARMLWKFVQLPGHWLCFGVTVVTTLVSWLVMRHHIANPAMAWVIALGNGILSAAITEAFRQAYEWLVLKWRWMNELVQLRGLSDDPNDTISFLGWTFGKPAIRTISSVWYRFQSHLPRVRMNPNGFWMPV